MEEKGEINFGVTVKGDEASESYRISLRGENPPQFGGPTMLAAALPTAEAAPPSVAAVSTLSVTVPTTEVIPMKKKRGRPRKYGPDGKVKTPLSPMPISSSVPLTGEFPAWKTGRGKPLGSINKTHKFEFGNSGEKIAFFGGNFTAHIITVNAGEDVTMKVMSFSQQGSRAICILSANGTISNVTLRQPTSSGGTLTYEGRFEILSLSGSFMPTENGGTKSRSGGMSVSLAGPDGRVVGGGLAGFLVAAGPVQVVVGSFLPGLQQEHKPKKQRVEHAAPVSPITANPLFGEEMRGAYGGIKPLLTSPTFQRNNSVPSNLVQDFKILAADNKTSLPGEISKDPSQSNYEVSC